MVARWRASSSSTTFFSKNKKYENVYLSGCYKQNGGWSTRIEVKFPFGTDILGQEIPKNTQNGQESQFLQGFPKKKNMCLPILLVECTN